MLGKLHFVYGWRTIRTLASSNLNLSDFSDQRFPSPLPSFQLPVSDGPEALFQLPIASAFQ